MSKETQDTEAISTVSEAPRENCIHVATKWGSVFLRVHPERDHWTTTTLMLTSDYEIGRWYESRAYAEERRELLKHEHRVIPMEDHPKW